VGASPRGCAGGGASGAQRRRRAALDLDHRRARAGSHRHLAVHGARRRSRRSPTRARVFITTHHHDASPRHERLGTLAARGAAREAVAAFRERVFRLRAHRPAPPADAGVLPDLECAAVHHWRAASRHRAIRFARRERVRVARAARAGGQRRSRARGPPDLIIAGGDRGVRRPGSTNEALAGHSPRLPTARYSWSTPICSIRRASLPPTASRSCVRPSHTARRNRR